MRTSQLLLSTLKETPADAEVISHQLMLRAGLIRKLASGLYTWLPLGLRVLRKIEAIVREEMQNAGAQEILMPIVQPAELWEESGRWEQYGAELLRLVDRHRREFCLGPTHEEVVTDLVRNNIQSYKQLPLNLYQIQTKFRDEIRPRFGVMRSREFIMKDAYSFHMSQECLSTTYEKMHQAYSAIFSRLGLNFRAVLADTGSIGGNASHEFHVLAASGEDDIAFSNNSDYAANVELAEAVALEAPSVIGLSEALTKIATPDVASIQDVCAALNITSEQTVKTLLVKSDSDTCDTKLVALVIRGDHQLNELKAEKIKIVKAPLEFASEQEVLDETGCTIGSLGPINLNLPIIADRSAAILTRFVCGANEEGFHLDGASWEQATNPMEIADIRCVVTGDPSPDGEGSLDIKKGIEVGHIFQLGEKYSTALNAVALNDQGKTQTLTMGCYGIGITRIVAAAIEQYHDDRGIRWSPAMAPYQIAIIPINYQKSEAVKQASDKLYDHLESLNIEVLMDDRNERPGVKFADMELIGIPHQVVIGDKSLAKNMLEYRNRSDGTREDVALDAIQSFLSKSIAQST